MHTRNTLRYGWVKERLENLENRLFSLFIALLDSRKTDIGLTAASVISALSSLLVKIRPPNNTSIGRYINLATGISLTVKTFVSFAKWNGKRLQEIERENNELSLKEKDKKIVAVETNQQLLITENAELSAQNKSSTLIIQKLTAENGKSNENVKELSTHSKNMADSISKIDTHPPTSSVSIRRHAPPVAQSTASETPTISRAPNL